MLNYFEIKISHFGGRMADGGQVSVSCFYFPKLLKHNNLIILQMGKKQWRHRELDVGYRDYNQTDDVSYNAVEYIYPEGQLSKNRKLRPWETKNTTKFREMLQKTRKGANGDSSNSNLQQQNGVTDIDKKIGERYVW